MTATVDEARLLLPRTPPTGREAARIRFPARRSPETWSATCQSRDAVWDRLTRAPFVVDNAHTQKIRLRGLTFLLDWLEAQPGRTWQERWLASGPTPQARDGGRSRRGGCRSTAWSPNGG